MRQRAVELAVALFILVLSCSDAWAQATAQISGTAKDQSGAVLPGVEVGENRQPALALLFGFTMHHSLAGVYDSSREVVMEGVVTQFQFINPHAFLVIDVQRQTWKLEMDNVSELVDVGMTKETFKTGDRVVVRGHRAREKSQQALYIRKLDRPADGFQYEQVGTSPRINFKPR